MLLYYTIYDCNITMLRYYTLIRLSQLNIKASYYYSILIFHSYKIIM